MNNCTKNTIYNPQSNFMPFDNRDKAPACRELETNTTGIKNIYTMPVTTSSADTIEYAKFLFPNPARCRETGYMCVVNADSSQSLDRLVYYSGDIYYQTINTKKN